jgi:hypothetical protein
MRLNPFFSLLFINRGRGNRINYSQFRTSSYIPVNLIGETSLPKEFLPLIEGALNRRELELIKLSYGGYSFYLRKELTGCIKETLKVSGRVRDRGDSINHMQVQYVNYAGLSFFWFLVVEE